MNRFVGPLVLSTLTACTVVIPAMQLKGTYKVSPDGEFEITVIEAKPVDPVDAGVPRIDSSLLDTGPPPTDSGSPPPSPDAGPSDTGRLDAAPPASLDASFGLPGPPCCSSYDELVAQSDYPTPDIPMPGDGDRIIEPTFGTEIIAAPMGWRHEYSQLQAFNFDSTIVLLLNVDDGARAVFDVETMTSLHPIRGFYPRWLPGTNTVVSLVSGVKILYTDAVTGEETEHMDLSGTCRRAGAQGYEEISKDGRWIGVYCRDPNETFFFVDLIQRQLGWISRAGDVCGGGEGLDWVGAAPVGNQASIQWKGEGEGGCRGHWTYDVKTGAPGRNIRSGNAHSDQGVDATGRMYLITRKSKHPNFNGVPSVAQHWYDGAPDTHLRMIPWNRAIHLSCQSAPGDACVIWSSNDPEPYGGRMHRGEVWLQHLDGRVTRLAHHRSVGGCSGSRNYWSAPMASISPDGRYAIFGSDWGTACAQIRSYVVRLR